MNQDGQRAGRPADGRGRLVFGAVADQYERYRQGYPGDVVDAVLDCAGTPVRSALKVGAGTGKATRVFAARGIHVTALEPDAGMMRVLERSTRGMPVEPVLTTFEGFRSTRRFEIVYAAAAWHWIDPSTRWSRSVELLAPGGVLALIGNLAEVMDPRLRSAVDDIEKQVLPDDRPGVTHPWSAEEIAADGGLGDVVRQDLPLVTETTATEFLGRLATVSAYLLLGAEARADALRRVGAVLPDRFDVDNTVQLVMARRR